MKFSLVLTALVLAAGLVPGLFYQKRVGEVRERQESLRRMAESRGIHLPADDGSGRSRVTKRVRSGNTKAARAAGGDFLRFAHDLEARGNSSRFDSAMNQRGQELLARLAALGPEELKSVLEDLRAEEGISLETKRNLIGFTVLTMSASQPEAAARFAADSADLLGDSVIGEQALLASVQRWAERDPQGAAAWLKTAAANRPELAEDDVKRSLVGGVAKQDPAEAFRMLGSMGFDDISDGVEAIMNAASDSPAGRDSVLAALRGHLATMTDAADREEVRAEGYAALARSMDVKDFETSSAWLDQAGLSGEELAAFATGLGYFDAEGETGRWIGWLASRLDIDDLEEPVQEMMGEWTQQDYLAAGNWLAAEAESPGKRAAVAAYAEAVAEYEPQVAVQWAMTLPDTWRRTEVLRSIHENWPEDDPQGAAAFAEQHGIK
ncbi:MAG: hypothetical protein H7A49_16735 [Akkermansiaceae bacterium]|nr:hypothetical protein [Akkermansiaceae bacterium]MCP5545544.1 hypothetical protein [Akkermansiaceae bacterium]MCP5546746.1 hypothetical protein [Akkermansiaceae bacterium]